MEGSQVSKTSEPDGAASSFQECLQARLKERVQEHAQDPIVRKWSSRLVIFLVVIASFRWLDSIKSRWYVFNVEQLHELQLSAIAASPNDTAGMIAHIVANLTATYPATQVAFNTDSSEWVFNNAGGAMGAMYLIHASLTEYLIIFGTPLGTEGHSGSHPADDYFYILEGEEWAFEAGALVKERYGPGAVHHLPKGVKKQYKMHEGCFALEYAVGFIPTMMPFGMYDTFSSTMDFGSLWKTVRISAREMIRNLMLGKI